MSVALIWKLWALRSLRPSDLAMAFNHCIRADLVRAQWLFPCLLANRWPSLSGLLMWRWFSGLSFRSDGLAWDVHNTSLLLVKHFVFGSWKAITLWLYRSTFSQTFAGVMWSVLVNAVREGMVNLPEHALV